MATITYTRTAGVTARDNEYEVLVRDGEAVASLGRVQKFGPTWAGLAVGASAWTAYRSTRAAAVEDMRRGITFRTPYLVG